MKIKIFHILIQSLVFVIKIDYSVVAKFVNEVSINLTLYLKLRKCINDK